jgi:hypothetical protein
MAYDWTPTASRTATTDPNVVAVPGRSPKAAAPPRAPSFEDIGVAAAVQEFIHAAGHGQALNRSGRPYRPSAFRDLRGILTHHVVRDLGDLRLRDVRRRHVQALIDRLAADGLSVSRIRSVISALRALYGYAIEQGYAEFSPADGLVLPPDHEPSRDWRDDADAAWEERTAAGRRPPRRRTAPAEAPPEPPRPDRDTGDYQPLALLPERILSLVLRIVVVVFILFALVTIVGSA